MRGDLRRDNIEVATLDPFHGYTNAIDDQREAATAVPDAFCVVTLDPKPSTTSAGTCNTRPVVIAAAPARLKRTIAAHERHDERSAS